MFSGNENMVITEHDIKRGDIIFIRAMFLRVYILFLFKELIDAF